MVEDYSSITTKKDYGKGTRSQGLPKRVHVAIGCHRRCYRGCRYDINAISSTLSSGGIILSMEST